MAYIIKLSSPRVLFNDRDAHIITLDDYTRLAYDEITDLSAIKFQNVVTNHHVCSENCENYSIKQPLYTRDDYFDRVGVQYLGEMNVSWRCSLLPQALEKSEHTCDECGRMYLNTHWCSEYKIIHKIVQESYYGDPRPKIMGDIFGLSDFNEQHKEGHIYSYKVGMPIENKQFCSNECRYKYSIKTNSIVVFPNILMNGCLTCITPDTKAVNNNLQNVYNLRPQKLTPINY